MYSKIGTSQLFWGSDAKKVSVSKFAVGLLPFGRHEGGGYA